MTPFRLAGLICMAAAVGWSVGLLADDRSSREDVVDAHPAEAAPMPDIAGTWKMRGWQSEGLQFGDEVTIRRSPKKPAELELAPMQPPAQDGEEPFVIPLAWTPGTRRFTAKFANEFTTQNFTFQVAAGNQSMRVTIDVDEKTKQAFAARGMSEAQIDERLNQVWMRNAGPVPNVAARAESQTAAADMPDISGLWQKRSWRPNSAEKVVDRPREIRRSDDPEAPFRLLAEQPAASKKTVASTPMKWIQGTRRFEATYRLSDQSHKIIRFHVDDDNQSMRVIEVLEDASLQKLAVKGKSEAWIDAQTNQIWTRKPEPDATVVAEATPAPAADKPAADRPDLAGLWMWYFPEPARQKMPQSQLKAKVTRSENKDKWQLEILNFDLPKYDVEWLPEEKLFEAKSETGKEPKGWFLLQAEPEHKSYKVYPVGDEAQRKHYFDQLRTNPKIYESFGSVGYKQIRLNRPIASDRIHGGNFLVIETAEGLDGYSETTGAWDRIPVPRPKDGFPRLALITVGLHLAAVVLDDQLLAFNGDSGKWSRANLPAEHAGRAQLSVGIKFGAAQAGDQLLGFCTGADRIGRLTIPPEYVGKVAPTIGQNSLTVQFGDKTWALSPKTGQWTSPDGTVAAAATETVAADSMPDLSGNWQIQSPSSGPGTSGLRQFQRIGADWVMKFPDRNLMFGLEWQPAERAFLVKLPGAWGEEPIPFRLSYSSDEEKITLTPILDEAVQQRLAALVDLPDESTQALEKRFTQVLTRNIPDRIQGGDLLIVETKDGLDGYSQVRGTWDRIPIGLPQNGFPRLSKLTAGMHFATVVIDDQLLGYSSQAGKWGKMTIPPEFVGKVTAIHSQDLVTATVGDKTYALSPTTGQWTSADGKPKDAVDAKIQITRIPLKHGTASLFRRMLRAFYPDANIQVDERTNSLVVATIDDTQLGEIQAILKRLDVPEAESEASNRKSNAGEVLVFTAKWSGPCQQLVPIVKPMIGEGFPLRLIDVDQQADLVKRYQIQSIPTLIVLTADGTQVRRHSGLATKEQLLEFVKQAQGGGDVMNSFPHSTLDTSAVRSRGGKFGPRLDSPAARRLADEIAEQETEARQLAEQVRNQFGKMTPHDPHLWKVHRDPNPATCLACHDAASKTEAVQIHEKLNQTLGAALDLKFQLEALQVQDLQGRLSRLEQQIGQRKAQRQKIIERRAQELIEGDATRWESGPAVEPGSTKRLGADRKSATAPSWKVQASPGEPIVARIQITGPEGMQVTSGNFTGTNFLPYDIESLQPVNDPLAIRFLAANGKSFHGGVRIYPVNAQTISFWKTHTIPLVITNEDVDQITAGNVVIKVLYLSETGLRDPDKAVAETLVSTRLDPGVDLVREADKLGETLVVLRLSKNKDQPVATTANPFEVRPQAEIITAEPPQAAPADVGDNATAYQRFVTTLLDARHTLVEAESKLKRLEILAEKKVVTQAELEQAKRLYETSSRREQLLHDSYRATLRDLELQINAAAAEAKRLETLLELTKLGNRMALQSQQGLKAGIDPAATEKVQQQLNRSRLDLQRLQNKYKLYKKAGEGLIDPPKSGAEEPLAMPPNIESSGTEAEAVWNRLGLKLAPLPASENHLVGPKYRGGMRVVEVNSSGPSAGNGIRRGDILVGLGKWETISAENVAWVLRQPDAVREVRFFLIRGQETMFGLVPLKTK